MSVDLLSELKDRKGQIANEHAAYIESHPELRQVLNDFVSACLVHKPRDVVAFASKYFSSYLPEAERSKLADKQDPVAMSKAGLLRPVVICGPSGVGKGTLINRLMTEFPPKFGFSVSHTTRAPRPGEVNGVHYNFTSIPDMEADIAKNKFIEYARVHGNMYGTSIAAVQQVCDSGKVCVLDIDVQGAQQVKKTSLNAMFIFIAPPSMAELEKRLRGRNTETEDKIKLRLENAVKEVKFLEENPGFFDKVITNDNLDVAYEELKNLFVL
eukprot:tig00021534_g22242.t1